MNVLDFVDTRQGTNNQHQMSRGNVLPYTILPFGRHPFSMISAYDDVRFFNGNHHTTYGVRLTHQPSPWMGDFDFLNLNFLGLTTEEEDKLQANIDRPYIPADLNMSSYKSNNSIFRPNNLQFRRLRDGINFDLVPTEYGASLEFSQDREYKSERNYFFTIAISSSGELKQSSNRQIQGYTDQMSGSKYSNYKLYFNLDFDCDIELAGQTDYQDNNFALTMYWFKVKDNLRLTPIHLYLNASYISIEQALLNRNRDFLTKDAKVSNKFFKSYGKSMLAEFNNFSQNIWSSLKSKVSKRSGTDADSDDFFSAFTKSFNQAFEAKNTKFNGDGDKINLEDIFSANFRDLDQDFNETFSKYFAAAFEHDFAHLVHTALKNYAENKWLDYLNRIEVSSSNLDKVKTFYTNLYRTATFPNKAYEFNGAGDEVHFSASTGKAEAGILYINNGYWDTFRTAYPLYSIICPEMVDEFIQGIMTVGREDKFLPRWLSPDERGLMPGSSVDSVIADAVIKDLVSEDTAAEVLEQMIFSAENQGAHKEEGREGGEAYRQLGYVPCDIGVSESVNKTQDYAYSDFAIAQVAHHLGRDDIARKYYRYSLNYRNLFDPESGQMLARDSRGNFVKGLKAHRWGQYYTEGSAWQNSLSVFYNFADLINLYGGDQAFSKHMIELVNQIPEFEIGGYGNEIHEISEMAVLRFGQLAISNQPSFHFPYLFVYAGYPNLSEYLLKQLLENLFSYDINGFPGDEDNGSMSSWYVLSSLGIYPVCPGTDQFIWGINIWDDAKIHLDNNKTIHFTQDTIEPYLNVVQARFVNGEKYTKSYINYADLMAGLEIEQVLGVLPDLTATAPEERPFSLQKDLDLELE